MKEAAASTGNSRQIATTLDSVCFSNGVNHHPTKYKFKFVIAMTKRTMRMMTVSCLRSFLEHRNLSLIVLVSLFRTVEIQQTDDIESGGNGPTSPPSPTVSFRSPLSSVVPVYRRECQSEVYVGSHTYPGEGVYLLKFDNSYSLWRSKTLYYRVFYTR